MNKIKQLASKSPVTFGLVITLTFIVLIIFSAVFANRWETETQNWYIANTIGRLIAISILMVPVAGLGWLKSSGFTHPGRWFIWLLSPVLLAYGIIASSYALTGSVALNIPGSALISAMGLFLMSHALVEEVTFRGLVLPAFLNRWGGTTRGIIKAVAVSSIFFAAMHFLNVLGGNPLPVVLLQAAGGYFLGIFFGGLVVSGRSIYPVVLLHGLMNIAAQQSLLANSSATGDPSAWLWQTLLMIPLAVVGLYLIWTTTRQPASRSAFIISKSVAFIIGFGVTAVLIPTIVFLLVAILGFSLPVDIPYFLIGLSVSGLHLLFYLMLTVMLGTLFNSRGPITGIGVGLLLAGMLLNGIFPLELQAVTPWLLPDVGVGLTFQQPLPDIWFVPIVACAVWVVVFTVVSLCRFGREEF